MTQTTEKHNLLLKFVSKALKYFLLALVGFAIAYIVAISLGGSHIATPMLFLAANLIFRFGIVLFCLIATVIILESLR